MHRKISSYNDTRRQLIVCNKFAIKEVIDEWTKHKEGDGLNRSSFTQQFERSNWVLLLQRTYWLYHRKFSTHCQRTWIKLFPHKHHEPAKSIKHKMFLLFKSVFFPLKSNLFVLSKWTNTDGRKTDLFVHVWWWEVVELEVAG